MILLKNTTSSLKLVTTTTAPTAVIVVFDRLTNGNDLEAVDTQLTNISTATNTTILSNPPAGVRFEVRSIMIHNTSLTLSNNITLNQDENGTLFEHYDCTIGLDEKVQFDRNNGYSRLNRRGTLISDMSEPSYPTKSHCFPINKLSVGTSEAAGIYHFMGTGAGFPAAWTIGTSGLAGRAVQKTETGFLNLPTTPNKLVLTKNGLKNNAAALAMQLVDVLFVNNGIVVTSTTAQTLNTVPLPARDNNGAALGEGCIWGILVTTATTNAAAIANMTCSYTNQAGTAARIGTIPSFPATAAVGTFVPINPQAGDFSIQTVQTITLGTTLTAGAVSLVCLRVIDAVQTPGANLADYYAANKKVNIVGNEALTFMVMAVGASAYVIPPSEIIINEYLN